jgi:YesN/AraC family two-component response regulator
VIYDYIHKYRLSPHVIRYLGYSVAAAAMKSLEDMNISSRTSISLKEILAIDHVEEMVTCIEHIYREACRLISLEKESHNVHLIDSIHEYINRYYANPDLSLTNAAEAFCISSSYLSRFFKNQTGYNFIECLNKRRIEASQRLFTGDITVLEVAKQVGFDNDITFRRLFKKYTGMTPSQFYKGK